MRGTVALEGSLVVGPQAQLTAPIRARRVEVHGEVVGDIEAAHVIVRSGGWVSGDVRASSIAIDDGATLEGLVDMDFDDARSAARRSR
jgi:cytoskeletal protein CcmA (bactofilin family)